MQKRSSAWGTTSARRRRGDIRTQSKEQSDGGGGAFEDGKCPLYLSVCVLPACEERGLYFYSDLLDQSGETEFLSLEGARHLGEP